MEVGIIVAIVFVICCVYALFTGDKGTGSGLTWAPSIWPRKEMLIVAGVLLAIALILFLLPLLPIIIVLFILYYIFFHKSRK